MAKKSRAFSLIELSIVILIIGILIAGVTQASRLVRESKLKTAQTLTKSSPVSGISGLALWLETSLDESFVSQSGVDQTEDETTISQWNDINPQSSAKYFASNSTSYPSYSSNSGPNDLPSVHFSSDNYLNLSNTQDGATGVPIITPNNTFSLFVVYKLNPLASAYNFDFSLIGEAYAGATATSAAEAASDCTMNMANPFPGCSLEVIESASAEASNNFLESSNAQSARDACTAYLTAHCGGGSDGSSSGSSSSGGGGSGGGSPLFNTVAIQNKGAWKYDINDSSGSRKFTGSDYNIIGAGTSTSSTEIISATFNGSTLNSYFNGSSDGQGSLTSSATPHHLGISGSDTYVSEVIVFDRALKNEERQAVEDYLGKKYNTSISR